MLWTIFVILLILWLLGMVSSYTLGGFIHLLQRLSEEKPLPGENVTEPQCQQRNKHWPWKSKPAGEFSTQPRVERNWLAPAEHSPNCPGRLHLLYRANRNP